MSPIEDYIHHATLGLPKDERVELAAHLRETLHEAVERLEALVLDRELAERLVLREAGPPSRMNRRLLGHIFTHHLGWQVLSVLVVVVASWLAADAWRESQQVQQTSVNTVSVATMLINPARFVIDLPHDVGNVRVSYSYPSGSRTLFAMELNPDRNAGTSLEPDGPHLEIGMGELPNADSSCTSSPWPTVSLQQLSVRLGGSQRRSVLCTPVPEGYLPSSWEPLGSSITTDEWVPVAVYKPLIEESRGDPGDAGGAYSVVRFAPAEHWLVVSVWAGRDVNEAAVGSGPPGMGWVRERMPGAFVEFDEQEGRR